MRYQLLCIIDTIPVDIYISMNSIHDINSRVSKVPIDLTQMTGKVSVRLGKHRDYQDWSGGVFSQKG